MIVIVIVIGDFEHGGEGKGQHVVNSGCVKEVLLASKEIGGGRE